MSARTWLREPLVHFSVLGLALFGVYAVVGDRGEEPAGAIRVSAETQARIESQHERRLGRAPTGDELDAAIRDWADAEMLYREARRLGLDRGDPIVRRRLTQKMRFLFEESAALPEPSDAELEAWIAEHSERFEQGPRTALTHVFVASSSRVVPEATLVTIEEALAEGADPATLGQAFPLGQEIGPKTGAELDRSFGPGFGEAVAAMSELGWHRARSLYGWHLVHIEERIGGRLAGVDEVRAQARAGLLEQARAEAQASAMAELRERYELVVEGRDG